MAYGDELLRHVASVLDQVVVRMTLFASQIPTGGGAGGGGTPSGEPSSQQPEQFPGIDKLIEAVKKFEAAVTVFQDMSGKDRTGLRVIIERIEQDATAQLEAMVGRIAGRGSGMGVPVPVSGSPPQNAFGQMFGQAKKAAGTAVGALGNQNSLAGMSSVISAIGQLGGMIPGIGTAIAAVSKFGSGLLDSVDIIKKWGDNLIQGNAAFAQFSSSMTSAMMEKQFRDIVRSSQQGERRSESTRRAVESQANLQDELAPLQDAWNNGMQDLMTGLRDGLFTPIAKILRIAAGYEKEPDEEVTQNPFGSPVVGEWMGRSQEEVFGLRNAQAGRAEGIRHRRAVEAAAKKAAGTMWPFGG